MTVLLLLCGAIAVFVAGWSAARTFAAPDAVVEPPPEPVPADSTYLAALERHPVGVVVASPNGAVEYRNAAALELAGTHVGVLIDEAAVRHLDAARAGEPSGEVLDLYGPPRRVVVVSSQPLPGGRAVAFVDDISDRRRADQARTDFVANVSHELRTPIGALMVLAETLGGERDPEVIDRVVTRMQCEGERAARIIDDLLQLSEIESRVERDHGPVPLRDVIADAVRRVAEPAAANEVSVVVADATADDGGDAGGPTVDGDRPQLASAIGNLVENAVKYSDPGGTVRIELRCDGGSGEIAVVDEGEGIPRRDLDRVFERFYRVDRARSRGTGGTGLGLSIVRHVAENHRGTITVTSTEGEGSTFVLRVPLIGADHTGAHARGREGVA